MKEYYTGPRDLKHAPQQLRAAEVRIGELEADLSHAEGYIKLMGESLDQYRLFYDRMRKSAVAQGVAAKTLRVEVTKLNEKHDQEFDAAIAAEAQ